MKTINHSLMALLLFFGLFTGQALLAAEGAPHKVVIQVSTDDPRTQTIALNNAVNLQNALGQDNVQIEIVAYGPGLGMLTSESKVGQRITSLAMQDIQFSACGNTMKAVEKKTGTMPVPLEGVSVVQAGVLRIMELQEQGYAYVRP
ncbi:DsrE family protein [Sedimenticola hydrogenitrophicus]|uniref:DsrE family protein n=1 Tax=Sedimenticola hydrogenitrophicus TaxID=2967975 RepID=UPI0023B1795E|nr:DsrE family protein [Sedimenticola hydrogenitrophicus]